MDTNILISALMSDVLSLIIDLVYTAILLGVITLLFRWLWNKTVPSIFKLPNVNFWQALRLLIISHIIFGGRFLPLGELVSRIFETVFGVIL